MISTVSKRMHQAIAEGVFPGGVLLVSCKGNLLFHDAFGVADIPANEPVHVDSLFDLASLTKPLATALSVLKLIEKGMLSLSSTLEDLLPTGVPYDKAGITVSQLLRHISGLPAHRPYYQIIGSRMGEGEACYPEMAQAHLRQLILNESLLSHPGERQLYSDLGYILLCWIIEYTSKKPLNQFVLEHLYRPLGISDLYFVRHFSRGRSHRHFVSTENCPWRKKILKGEVHDDNAWIAGGVEGHAGLFGTAKAVWKLLYTIMQSLGAPECTKKSCRQNHSPHEESAPFFKSDLLAQFLSGGGEGKMVAGFDTPSIEKSSSGRYLSKWSIGHLGFTGTSFWMDPTIGLIVVLLTNRVHPHRDNEKIRQFRPQLHDRVVETFHFGDGLYSCKK